PLRESSCDRLGAGHRPRRSRALPWENFIPTAYTRDVQAAYVRGIRFVRSGYGADAWGIVWPVPRSMNSAHRLHHHNHLSFPYYQDALRAHPFNKNWTYLTAHHHRRCAPLAPLPGPSWFPAMAHRGFRNFLT